MPTQFSKTQQRAVHGSADYYEALFRARFVRALKRLQQQTSINQLAMALQNSNSIAYPGVDRKAIAAAIAPLQKVIVQAFMRGGKHGASHVKATLHG